MAVELASPLWLAGLGLIPALYWLHRFQGAERAVMVSALFLWPRPDSAGGNHRHGQSPPRVWLLRALVVALTCLALTRPALVDKSPPPLIVWIDESVSMRAVENGRTRMAAALADLGQALDARENADVTVRSLADPARVLTLSPDRIPAGEMARAIGAWSNAYRGEPRAPMPALALADTEYWLVTDGASPGIDDWLARWPFSRVMTTGAAASNAGIVRLSLRRSPADAGAFAGLVELHNAGPRPVTRDVRLSADGRALGNWSLLVPAGESRYVEVRITDGLPRRLKASLAPGDTLASDDELQLSTDAIAPVAYAVFGACSPILRAALKAHPGLVRATGNGVFSIRCGGTAGDQDRPQLVFEDSAGSDVIVGPLAWSDAPGMPFSPFEVRARPVAQPGRVLASVNHRPVIVQTSSKPPMLRAGLDLSIPAAALSSAELVSVLVEKLLHRPILDVVAHAEAAGPTAIGPRRVAIAARPRSPVMASSTVGATAVAGWLALAACLLVLADMRVVLAAAERSMPLRDASRALGPTARTGRAGDAS